MNRWGHSLSSFGHIPDETIEFLGSVFAICAVSALALSDLDVSQEALNQGVLGNAEQCHVHRCYHVADQEDSHKGRNGAVELIINEWPVDHNHVADCAVYYADKHLSDEDEDCGNALSHKEGARVLENQKESTQSRGAEVLWVKCDLHESVLVQELDESVAALETASAGKDQALCDWVQLLVIST